MEFAKLIQLEGEWNKIWLAAHWDRRLKKQDYFETDLVGIIADILQRRGLVSLRAMGHLLLGACKIYIKKVDFLTDEAREVHTKLVMAFANELGQADGEGGVPDGLGVLEGPGVLDDAGGRGVLVAGQKHVARLEDITLKVPMKRATAADALEGMGDMLGPGRGTLEEFEAAIAEIRGVVAGLQAPDSGPLDMPAPGLGSHLEAALAEELDDPSAFPIPLDSAGPGADPIPLDYPEPAYPEEDGEDEEDEEGGEEHGEPPAGVPAEDGVAQDAAAPVAKRRKKAFVMDEQTEIPKEIYQQYVNDRRHITRSQLLDYTILLPHYAPNLPGFMTTFTDVCDPLAQSLLWGREVADKRRRLAADAEGARMEIPEALAPLPDDEPAAPPPAAVPDLPAPSSPSVLPAPTSPTAFPAGIEPPLPPDSPSHVEMGWQEPSGEAPENMRGVVTGHYDEEDMTANPTANVNARVGYSARTEKMHRWLAKEFIASKKPELSYGSLCQSQARGRRELIAGCFFELLVLRTNGVINLEQQKKMGDIQIFKADQWNTTENFTEEVLR